MNDVIVNSGSGIQIGALTETTSVTNTDVIPIQTTGGTKKVNVDNLLGNTKNEILSKDDKAKEFIIFNNAKTNIEIRIVTTTYDVMFLKVTECYDTTIRVVGTPNSKNYYSLNFVNVDTGISSDIIATKGIYQIDTIGLDDIKISNKISVNNASVVSATLLNKIVSKIPYGLRKSLTKTEYPTGIANFTNMYNNGYMFKGCRNGVIYALKSGKDVWRSEDLGGTWLETKVMDVDKIIQRLIPFANGNILALMEDGKLYKTNTGFSTFTLVKDFANLKPNTFFGDSSKFNGSEVWMCEYSTQKTPPIACGVWRTVDYGNNWGRKFNLLDQGISSNCHVHDVAIDEYENLVWICTGDGKANQMIFCSNDNGTTWVKCDIQGQAPTQSTQIIPLPDCVLFISDARLVNVIRYNRPIGGTKLGQPLKFEVANVIAEEWGNLATPTEVPIASHAYVDKKNGKAYFGYAIVGTCKTGSTNDDLKFSALYGTDGYTFKQIYKGDTATETWMGVQFVSGFEKDNKSYVLYEGHPYKGVFDVTDLWK